MLLPHAAATCCCWADGEGERKREIAYSQPAHELARFNTVHFSNTTLIIKVKEIRSVVHFSVFYFVHQVKKMAVL